MQKKKEILREKERVWIIATEKKEKEKGVMSIIEKAEKASEMDWRRRERRMEEQE